MKVYFDIITNHTADVIGYEEGARHALRLQGRASRTARPTGTIFDDRDYAGSAALPALDPETSFPYAPVLDPAEQTLKVPAWLNDLTLYHNRGDTTFVGENSLYGDFFGLDDLFTENPRVVQGMIDIYKTWIADFGVDGFRIDTMKHVDDAFWQRFGPEVLAFARAQRQARVLHVRRGLRHHEELHVALHDHGPHAGRARLPVPGGRAGASRPSSAPTDELRDFFAGDDWYTDADSNVYQLPTFLGQPRHGAHRPLRQDRQRGRRRRRGAGPRPPGARADVPLARQPGHLLRRRAGLRRRRRRPGRAAGHVPEPGRDLQRRRPDRHRRHDGRRQLRPHAPAVPCDRRARPPDAAPRRAARRRAASTACRRRAPASTRSPASTAATSASTWWCSTTASRRRPPTVPTYAGEARLPARLRRRRAAGSRATAAATLHRHRAAALGGRLQALGPHPAAARRHRASRSASPRRARPSNAPARGRRRPSTARRSTRSRSWPRPGAARGRASARTTTRRTASSTTSPGLPAGTDVDYRALVLDNRAPHAVVRRRDADVPAPKVTIEAPPEGAKVRGHGRAARHRRSRARHPRGAPRSACWTATTWTSVGTDDSSPAYIAIDDISGLGLAAGTTIHYRAILTEPDGTTSTSDGAHGQRGRPAAGRSPSCTTSARPATTATGACTCGATPSTRTVLAQVAWETPWPLTDVVDGLGALRDPAAGRHEAGQLHHAPARRRQRCRTPASRAATARSSPLDHPEIWLKQGDPTVYFSQPPVP